MTIKTPYDLEIALLEKETCTLSDLLNDIWIEDERREDINDLDRMDMTRGIMEWVEAGVENNSWTIEGWHDMVLVDES